MIGSKLDIFKKEWLDVVFEGRNKSYGAYELRKIAPKATNMGLLIVIIASLLLVSIKVFNIQFSSPAPAPEPVVIQEVTLDDLEEIEPPKEEEEEPLPAEEKPQQIAQEPPAEDLIRFPEPKVVPNNQVKEEVASQEEFKDEKKAPARITLKGKPGSTGVPTGEFGPKKVDGQVTGVEKGDPSGGASNEIFTAVEVNPEPPGGMKAFMEWIAKNYSYPNAALEQGVNGVVEVAFVVEKDGSLTDINVKRDLSYGTGQAAVAMLKKAKKWKPGIQNGRPVRVAYTLPIRLNTISQ